MAKIMLVEDDRSLQEIYSIRLVAEGYDIAKADDGEEALAKAVQEKPDLIIADVMMPKISGFDMLDILRSQPETQNIKVIMMTALSSDDQRQRGEALGAERYLVKSQVGIEDVINTVHEVLGDKPNDNAKANIETLSNIPAPQVAPAPAPAAPVAPVAQPMPGAPVPEADALAAVPTTPTTTIQPTNPAAGPAPMPQQIPPNPGGMMPPDPNGGVPQNFNQAPAAMPGMIPSTQVATNPAAGAVSIPATQLAGGFPIAAPPMQGATTSIPPASMRATQNNALQMTDRIQPNAQLSAAIQAAETYARAAGAEKKVDANQSSGGERVIQPIHDPRKDAMREQMEKRIEEMLGDDANIEGPQAVTTRTARGVAPAPMPVPNVAQASAQVPTVAEETTQAQNKGLPPEIKQDPVEQAQNVSLAPDTNSQQDLVRAQLATQPIVDTQEPIQSTSVAQAQAVEAMTQQVAAAEQAEQVAATAAVPTEPEEEIIEPIQPSYITELENELSKEAENDMTSRMASELQDDDITKEAQARATANAATANAPAEVVEKSEVIEQAVANAHISPNIAQEPESESPESESPAAQPAPALAPQPTPAP
ncbi:MAG: response regulator [Candidatus Saccharibacteria bacterium]|nr:response regulator [Candidatus Saccharibacteria bacterium]